MVQASAHQLQEDLKINIVQKTHASVKTKITTCMYIFPCYFASNSKQ